MSGSEDPFVTAEEAIFETELHAFGLRDGPYSVRLTQPEAMKVGEYLFADVPGGMPREVRRFFSEPFG